MVERVSQRSADNKPILDESTESFHFSQPKTALYFNPEQSEGTGILHLTTKRAVWLDDADSSKGFSIPFRTIICHAIARGGSFEHFQSPSIYCQLESEDLYECRFVPEDASALDPMFKAFSECASMNPDPIEEDEGEFFYNADEMHVDGDAAAALDRFESVFQAPTEEQLAQMHQPPNPLAGTTDAQFADAPEGANGHHAAEDGPEDNDEDDDGVVHDAKLQRL